jgi:hypothetical protein
MTWGRGIIRFLEIAGIALITFIIRCSLNYEANPEIRLISPTGGEVFQNGDTLRISWEYKEFQDSAGFPTAMLLSLDTGKTFSPFLHPVTRNKPFADTFWVLPDSVKYFSERARLRIRHANNTGLIVESGDFSLRKKREYLVLLSPRGGEVYHAEDTVVIAWEYKNSSDKYFMTVLELSVNGGLSFTIQIFYASILSNTPQKDTFWIVPDDTKYFSEQARIQAYHYNKVTLTGISRNFTIRRR